MSIGRENLFNIYFSVKWFQIKEQMRIFSRYYRKGRFVLCDFLLSIFYLFFNPYRIGKKYLQRTQERNIYAYGETPLSTLEKMFRSFHIQKEDIVYEMGFGRGKNAFWIRTFWGCKVIGIERIKTFYSLAIWMQKMLRIDNMTFLLGDFIQDDIPNADIIYLYGTTLEDAEIMQLIDKFLALGKPIKIITISFSLEEYDSRFTTLQETDVRFPWGQTTAYLNTLKNP